MESQGGMPSQAPRVLSSAPTTTKKRAKLTHKPFDDARPATGASSGSSPGPHLEINTFNKFLAKCDQLAGGSSAPCPGQSLADAESEGDKAAYALMEHNIANGINRSEIAGQDTVASKASKVTAPTPEELANLRKQCIQEITRLLENEQDDAASEVMKAFARASHSCRKQTTRRLIKDCQKNAGKIQFEEALRKLEAGALGKYGSLLFSRKLSDLEFETESCKDATDLPSVKVILSLLELLPRNKFCPSCSRAAQKPVYHPVKTGLKIPACLKFGTCSSESGFYEKYRSYTLAIRPYNARSTKFIAEQWKRCVIKSIAALQDKQYGSEATGKLAMKEGVKLIKTYSAYADKVAKMLPFLYTARGQADEMTQPSVWFQQEDKVKQAWQRVTNNWSFSHAQAAKRVKADEKKIATEAKRVKADEKKIATEANQEARKEARRVERALKKKTEQDNIDFLNDHFWNMPQADAFKKFRNEWSHMRIVRESKGYNDAIEESEDVDEQVDKEPAKEPKKKKVKTDDQQKADQLDAYVKQARKEGKKLEPRPLSARQLFNRAKKTNPTLTKLSALSTDKQKLYVETAAKALKNWIEITDATRLQEHQEVEVRAEAAMSDAKPEKRRKIDAKPEKGRKRPAEIERKTMDSFAEDHGLKGRPLTACGLYKEFVQDLPTAPTWGKLAEIDNSSRAFWEAEAKRRLQSWEQDVRHRMQELGNTKRHKVNEKLKASEEADLAVLKQELVDGFRNVIVISSDDEEGAPPQQ